jgi:hypothetical protein
VFLSDWRVLVRRWYVTAGGLVVTAALCILAVFLVPAQHQTTAEVLMLPPKATGELAPGQINNPYLSLGGLEGVTDVLARALTDQAMARSLQARNFAGSYTVARDLSSAAPMLQVTVDDVSPARSLDTLAFLLGRIPPELEDAQLNSGVSRSALVVSTVLTRDTEPTTLRKSQIRALVVALAFGLALTFVGAAVLDGYLRGRRTGRIDDPTDLPSRRSVNQSASDRSLLNQPVGRSVGAGSGGGRRIDRLSEPPPEPFSGQASGRGAGRATQT